ncbi:CD209 antigen-like protein B isoform X1 [Alexandromys fortis]|uniref:CD209 antigen-like protein B isoform X1 n=1 Tax=Alexandromys fortis TaxID=100897 RepID=UPI0021531070|nr:CD209 antigen-like protein B isoform X1 [Microtus fortis]
MSASTEARMQQLGSVEDEEWMVSDTRCSNKSSRLRPHSGTKSLAGCLGRGQITLVLYLLSFLFVAGLLLIILVKVSKTPNTQGKEGWNKEIVQELTQLKDQLISQGRNESSQISEQLMQMKAELLSSILNVQVQNHSKQEKIYQQLVQMKAELFRLCRPCPWDWTFLRGNCYFVSKYQQNWSRAVKACQEVEAQLVIIQSDEEQSFLQQTSKAKGATWMGLSDLKKEGSWLWVDDSPLSSRFQKYWNRGEPNNIGEEDCVEFAGDGWNDSKCDLQKFWICKKSATPCTAS